MESMIVRKMEIEDIDAVLDIEKNSFSIPWTKNAFFMELKKNKLAKYCVVEVDGAVAGYGGMWLVLDEAHITNIAVHPKYRGMGVGKKIMDGLVGEGLRINIKRMTLEVRTSNLTAQGLYKNLGFMLCGIRPGYYTDNDEDALIMWKDL